MEARDFSAVTPEIEALAAKSRENNRIDISLYEIRGKEGTSRSER